MIVVKSKTDEVYMGRYLKAGVRIATDDINKAQRYQSVARAKAALKAMGYEDVERYDYVEVEE